MPTIFDRLGNAYNAFRGDRFQSDDDMSGIGSGGFSMTWNPFSAQWNDFQPAASLEQFGQNPYLYPAADIVATECARIPLMLKQRIGKKENREVEDHQADEVFRRPVPMDTNRRRTKMTQMQLRYIRNLHLILNGEAFWLLDDYRDARAGGAPQSIKPLLPQNMEARQDIYGFVSEYIYHYHNQTISYSPEQIVHFKKPDPETIARGHSPMKSARWAMGSYRKGEESNYHRLDNNNMPDGVLTSDKAVPEKERETLLEKFRARFGTPKKKARIGFMPHGVRYEALTQTNKDMQYVELLDKSKEAILANWRVPLDVLGMTKDNTRANAEAALFQFMRYVVLPIIEVETDSMTFDYLPNFPATESMFYMFADFIPENKDDKRKDRESLFGMGGLSPNEARQEMGRDELKDENAGRTFIPFSYMPLDEMNQKGSADSVDPKPKAKADDEDDDDPPAVKKPKEKKQAVTQAIDPNTDLLDDSFEQRRFAAILDPFQVRGFARGVEMAKRAKSKLKLSDVLSAQMRSGLKDQSVAISAEILQTSENDLKELIEDAARNGFSSSKLAANIRKHYENVAPIRAQRTARTVLTGSINNGQFRTLVAEGFKEKTWITITDGRQRDSHGKVHGTTVGINQLFNLQGGSGMFPGDDNLPSGEVINCRCDIVGSGTTEEFQRAHYQQFLKVHGYLETELVKILEREFINQGERAIKAIPS